ncbi:AsmA protein [Mucilaginibacter yixingensis]|uniref:AsmA protein n=1 Tax=Mucilaginibacter yixingensis TaxID=1295612 RepID=A0A2T5J640_9SPHI|nr:AsmA family protein [Mucilaginibacter yixingensis]PTQ94012.1 AsmA protein [Mucilaginibacter yixingensis]
MKIPLKKLLVKTLKISGITLGSIVLLMFLLPVLFPQTITQKIKQLANQHLNGQLSFSGTSLSFFKRFPELTLTLSDFDLKGSAPFERDTLAAAKEVSFAIDLSSLLRSKVQISKIYLSQATINIQVDSAGHANYNVYKASPPDKNAQADTAAASMGIDQIIIEKSRLVYNDASLPMRINARNFNYTGSGDLSKDVFDLHTHTEIGAVDFYYAGQAYVVNKKLNADLVTSINTKSLEFIFQKNDLRINQLPLRFKGRFGFMKDGYDMDFKFDSTPTDLSDIFTALPGEYAKYIEHTDVDGKGEIHLSLAGQYISAKKINPDLNFSLKINNGYVANNKTPSPVKDLYVRMNASVPQLNPDSLKFNLDSLHFRIDQDKFDACFRVKGINTPDIFARVNTAIDLEKWNRAFGVKAVDLKGRYELHLLAQGKYAKGVKKIGLRRYDTVIASVPKFRLQSAFTNGYIKYATLPEGVKNIGFKLDAQCPDNDIKHFTLALTDLNAEALSNFVKGYFKLSNTDGLAMDGGLKARFHLADLKKFYPADSIDVRGDLSADVSTKGRYIPAKKIFPVTNATVDLANGYIQTKYYPHPIEDLQISTNIINTTGTLAGMKIFIKPVSLKFEGQPFMVRANLQNFANLNYSMHSQGTLDIGKIYRVFAVKGYNVQGLITTNFTLKGRQSDAVAGRYDRLANSGSMHVKDLVLRSELFPKPFIIKKGDFSFNQDKMQFDAFTARYGRSVIVLNGALSNVLDYAVKPGATLAGNFNLKSDLLIADDFMAFAGGQPTAPSQPAPTSTASGVILVPKTLNLTFEADVKKVRYSGMNISDVKGQMQINNGQLLLKQAGFNLIGAPVVMDATYGSITPQRAYFDYHINAQNFDIKKAYNQIKLFHDMASSAASAEGIVSLDYKLGGRLNANMKPVYPSLKGGGVLSVKSVKLKGFRLFSTVGKQTGHDSLGRTSDVSKVDIKSSIANNIITIERTKMRFAGFRPRFEGQVDFKGNLNLKFRLGLPPFGIFGIPMTITGTQEHPKIHLGNGKKEDELQAEGDDGQ